MGVANAGAQKQIINTALYVLLHRTIAVGCPLPEEGRKKYLSTFRGSSSQGILLSAALPPESDLNLPGVVDTDNNIISESFISNDSELDLGDQGSSQALTVMNQPNTPCLKTNAS